MNAVPAPIALVMTRQNLNNLPAYPLPPGFAVKWFQPGDESRWLQIHLAAEREREITPALFRSEFGQDGAVLGERQCFLLDACGQAVGTATAWLGDLVQGERWGRVHWVAIRPEFQGRGLGRPLMTVVCERLRELGHSRAFLRTTATRLPAINLYLRFGFKPWPRAAAEAAAWHALAPCLRYPVHLR
jgi:GNAT superfamily N-acetyltransferase